MDLDPLVEALEEKKDPATLRLAGSELGTALEVESVPDGALERLDAALAGGSQREPYEEGVRDGVRAVISGVFHARRSSTARHSKEVAANEAALKSFRGEILDVLKKGQIVRPGQVARLLGKDPSQVGKELQAMHDDGLLLEQEFEDPQAVDKRGTYYQLSGRGIRQQEQRQASLAERAEEKQHAQRVPKTYDPAVLAYFREITRRVALDAGVDPHPQTSWQEISSVCVINGRERFSRLMTTSCAPVLRARIEEPTVQLLSGSWGQNAGLGEDD